MKKVYFPNCVADEKSILTNLVILLLPDIAFLEDSLYTAVYIFYLNTILPLINNKFCKIHLKEITGNDTVSLRSLHMKMVSTSNN